MTVSWSKLLDQPLKKTHIRLTPDLGPFGLGYTSVRALKFFRITNILSQSLKHFHLSLSLLFCTPRHIT